MTNLVQIQLVQAGLTAGWISNTFVRPVAENSAGFYDAPSRTCQPGERLIDFMRQCSACGMSLAEKQFFPPFYVVSRNKTKKYLCKGSRCRNCQRKVNRQRYEHHRKLIDEIKLKRGCERCGWKEAAVALDFHHKEPSGKDFHISQKVQCKMEKLMAEIEKCIVLCANCHRITHEEEYRR